MRERSVPEPQRHHARLSRRWSLKAWENSVQREQRCPAVVANLLPMMKASVAYRKRPRAVGLAAGQPLAPTRLITGAPEWALRCKRPYLQPGIVPDLLSLRAPSWQQWEGVWLLLSRSPESRRLPPARPSRASAHP